MLIEMVSVALAVFSGFSPLPGVFTASTSSPSYTSPIPPQALQSDLPEQEIVAMLAEPEAQQISLQESLPTPTPTDLPSPTPTESPTLQPKADRPLADTPTPSPTDIPTPTPQPQSIVAPGDLDSLFSRFAEEYHVDKEQLKRIAKCESGFNQEAVNGDYLGMFQFAASSWSSIRARMGADQNPDLRKNAEEAIKTTAYHIANGGANAWPSCK